MGAQILFGSCYLVAGAAIGIALIAASLVEYAPERKCSITGRFVQAVRLPTVGGLMHA